MSTIIAEPFGPDYNITSAQLEKFRRLARQAPLTREQREAYGQAVEDAVLASQRAALSRATPSIPRPNCASGTYHSSGEEIEKAIRQQQRNALLAYPAFERRNRAPNVWRKMYAAAMAEKAARE